MMGRRDLPGSGVSAPASEASTSAQSDASFADAMRRLRDVSFFSVTLPSCQTMANRPTFFLSSNSSVILSDS